MAKVISSIPTVVNMGVMPVASLTGFAFLKRLKSVLVQNTYTLYYHENH